MPSCGGYLESYLTLEGTFLTTNVRHQYDPCFSFMRQLRPVPRSLYHWHPQLFPLLSPSHLWGYCDHCLVITRCFLHRLHRHTPPTDYSRINDIAFNQSDRRRRLAVASSSRRGAEAI
ncbi:hypothetical protein FRC18_006789 [Serendipita sp. 400]|nr:hypothetical protein FRC18_006789 [Serendipita sp. 400]